MPSHFQALHFFATHVAILACFALSCGHDNTPEGAAEAFLYRYFIELNQRGALELSTGLAADKLDKEIALLQSVRAEPNLDLSQHKPFIDYKLVNTQRRDSNSATLFYDLTIESKSGNFEKQQMLSLINVDGEWKVNNFETFTKEMP